MLNIIRFLLPLVLKNWMPLLIGSGIIIFGMYVKNYGAKSVAVQVEEDAKKITTKATKDQSKLNEKAQKARMEIELANRVHEEHLKRLEHFKTLRIEGATNEEIQRCGNMPVDHSIIDGL